MPKSTYFNLNIDKREKIEKALLNEFSRVPFEKVAISNIVEEAKIPRGSFYQYFEDKEDAIKYIVEKYTKLEKETIKNILKECEGNIFDSCTKIFDYTVQRILIDSNWRLYKNIFEELKRNNINVFEEDKDIEEINQLIDFSRLNINTKDDIRVVLKILISITRMASMDVICKKVSVEEAKKDLEKQIKFLKNGMLK